MRRFPFPNDPNAGGILTGVPPINYGEWIYNGFNHQVCFSMTAFENPVCNNNIVISTERWADESRILAYLVDEEPFQKGISPATILARYSKLKRTGTQKPVGCLYAYNDGLGVHLNTINRLDFAILDLYPFRPGHSWARIEQLVSNCSHFCTDQITVPVEVMPQAMQDEFTYDPGVIGVQFQYNQYTNAGLSCCWYIWDGVIKDVKTNYQALMHSLYG